MDVEEGEGEGREGRMNPPGCWILEFMILDEIVRNVSRNAM